MKKVELELSFELVKDDLPPDLPIALPEGSEWQEAAGGFFYSYGLALVEFGSDVWAVPTILMAEFILNMYREFHSQSAVIDIMSIAGTPDEEELSNILSELESAAKNQEVQVGISVDDFRSISKLFIAIAEKELLIVLGMTGMSVEEAAGWLRSTLVDLAGRLEIQHPSRTSAVAPVRLPLNFNIRGQEIDASDGVFGSEWDDYLDDNEDSDDYLLN